MHVGEIYYLLESRKCVIPVVCVKIGKGMQSNTTMSCNKARKGRNMQLYNIAIKYTLIDIVVFDYIPFPIPTLWNVTPYSLVCMYQSFE